jgi:hypothetical protein
MTRRLTAALIGLALFTFVVVWAVVHYGFIYIGGRGFEIVDMVEQPVRVPVGEAEQLYMALHMVYGDLQLTSGNVGLLTGFARYNVAEFAPRVHYEESGSRGQLLMDHFQDADSTRLINRAGRVNAWQLAIHDQLPIEELEVVVGLGSGHLDLRGVDFRHSTLALIAGDFTVDLRGDREQAGVVALNGLTGEIRVLLPDQVGTLVMLQNVPRTLQVSGLTKLAAPPSPASIPAAALQKRDFPDGTAAEGEENDWEDWEDLIYYANSGYHEGSAKLYVQIADAFGTIRLIADAP